MDMLKLAITFLIPCNAAAPPVAELRDRLLYVVVEASSPSTERLRLEVVAEDTVEEGRIGVIGGRPTLSSSLESGPSLVCRGGPIAATPAAVLPLGLGTLSFAPMNVVFAMAPWHCSEGRNAWVPLTACGMIACIRSKCRNPFVLKGAASLFF